MATQDSIMEASELHALFLEGARESLVSLKASSQSLQESSEAAGERLASMADIAHILKGQGSSFGFPLITRISESLMRLLKGREEVNETSLGLIVAHVDALGIVIEKAIEGDGGDLGHALVARLDGLVDRVA